MYVCMYVHMYRVYKYLAKLPIARQALLTALTALYECLASAIVTHSQPPLAPIQLILFCVCAR